MIELGLVLLGVIGGIFIGYGWGRIAEQTRSVRHPYKYFANTPYREGLDPSDEAGA